MVYLPQGGLDNMEGYLGLKGSMRMVWVDSSVWHELVGDGKACEKSNS